MKENKNHINIIKEQAMNEGLGSLVAAYNDIEQMWYYYVGDFKPKNPSSGIHCSSIRGRCVNKIFQNIFTYFSGDVAKSELIRTEIRSIPEEHVEFDFRYIWFK